ncbi:MAG: hypothetical protein WCK78_04855 [Paludibacter sp.]
MLRDLLHRITKTDPVEAGYPDVTSLEGFIEDWRALNPQESQQLADLEYLWAKEIVLDWKIVEDFDFIITHEIRGILDKMRVRLHSSICAVKVSLYNRIFFFLLPTFRIVQQPVILYFSFLLWLFV